MSIVKAVRVWLGGAAGVTPPVHLSQYDTGWKFLFSIYDGSVVWSPAGAASVVLEGKKADGTVFAVPGVFADGVAQVTCTASISSAVGVISCELRVSEDGKTVGTANFDMIVEATPLTGYVASGDDFSAMQQILDDSYEAAAKAFVSANEAAASERAAAVSAATAQVQAGMAYKIAGTAADMTDHTIGYVYVGDEEGYEFGSWYYYDEGESDWVLGGTSVDATLLVAGAAADAKAVGDRFGAIRESVTSDFEAVTGNRALVFRPGCFSTGGDSTVVDLTTPTANDGFVCAVTECSPGDTFRINAASGGNHRKAFGWYNASRERIAQSNTGSGTLVTETIVAPANAAYLAVNNALAYNSGGYYAYKGVAAVDRIDFLTETASVMNGGEIIPFVNGGYIDTLPDGAVDPTAVISNSYFRCVAVSCSEGDQFTVTGDTTGYNYHRLLWEFISDEGTILTYETSGVRRTDLVITAPADAAYLICNALMASEAFLCRGIGLRVDIQNRINAVGAKIPALNDIIANGGFSRTSSGQVLRYNDISVGERYRLYVWSRAGMFNDSDPVLYIFYSDSTSQSVPITAIYGDTYFWDVTIPTGASYLRLYANKKSDAVSVACDYALVKVTGAIIDALDDKIEACLHLMQTLNRTTCKIFRKVVCCGDSYTSGHIHLDGESQSPTNENYAWPHYMETLTGNTWVNCGVSGANCLTWQSNERGLPAAQAAGKAQAYVLSLMINDASDSDRHVDVGTADDIGTEAETFYGGMSKIVRELNAISPTAKIFLNTCPKTASEFADYNQAVRDIVEAYEDTYPVFLIDLYERRSLYSNASLTGDASHGHYTSIGYEQFAEIYAYVLSDYINNHISDFQDVHKIPIE